FAASEAGSNGSGVLGLSKIFLLLQVSMLSLPTCGDTFMPKVIDIKLSDGKLLMTTLEHGRANTKGLVWPAIAVGLLGSVLLTIGSLSVGGSHKTPLLTLPNGWHRFEQPKPG